LVKKENKSETHWYKLRSIGYVFTIPVKMRLYLSLIFTSLTFLSLTTHAQTLEAIVGSENNFNDYAYAIAVDESKQCTYIAGSLEVTAGELIDPHDFFNINSIQGNVDQPSADAFPAQGGEDLFIAKINNDGIIDWFIAGGGPDNDAILDIAVGSDGNVYLTGYLSFPSNINYVSGISSTDFEVFGDNQNAVVISINDEGQFQWMDRLGSDDENVGLEIVDHGDGIAVSGLFTNSSDSDDDTTNNLEIFGLDLPEEDDWKGAYIAKIDYSGQCQWYRAYTSPAFSYDLSEAIKLTGSLDTDGDYLYLITILSGDTNYRCYSYENGSPVNNGLQNLASGTSVALFKISAEGELQWSRTELLPSGVQINSGPFVSVSCDDIYITATLTTSLSTPTTISLGLNLIPSGSLPTILFQRRAATTGQSELIRLFPAGNNSSDNYVTAIESDVQKRVYLAGTTNDNIVFETINNAANIISTGSSKNAWIKAMTRDSDNHWTQTINGNQEDEFSDIFLRGLGLVYFTGFTTSQTGLSMNPFGGSDPSSIYGKYSQSTTTGLSEFSLICPASLTLNSNSECGLENYQFPEAQVINPCVVQFRENNAPQVLPFGSTVVTFQAVGFNGVTQQCTTSVFVENVSLEPSIQCVPEIFRNTDENACSATVSLISPVIAGNCEPITITNNFNNSSNITNASFPVGTTTVVWTAFFTEEDDDGGILPITCNTKVHVSDITAPTMQCSSNLILPLTSEGIIGITVDQIDAGSFDACDIVERTISKTEFDCSNIGPNQVTLTAIDAHGNSNSCTTSVSVVDNIIPTAQCSNIEIQLDGTGTVSINPDQINNNSFDNCSISNLSLSQSTFNCSHLGENNITLTITDASGLQSACSATVLVLDLGNPPTVSAGEDLNLCGNASNVILNPILGEGVISVEWSGGLGNFQNGNTSASNIYIPTSAEIEAGSVTLTINAFGNSVCGSTSDNITITFSAAPTVFAGDDQQVCSDQVVVLNGATASNQTSVEWTGGAGTFTPSVDILQPNYTPTLEEFENGGVTLTITAQGGTGCAPVSDEIFIALAKKPIAEAGADQEICGNTIFLDGNAPPHGVGTWTATQSVTYTTNATDPTTQVTTDVFGPITFTWTVINQFCTTIDNVTITFFESPAAAEAGPDQTISFLGETTLNATATTIGQAVWSSNNNDINFQDKEDPNTLVSGLQPGQNVLYWIITNGPCTVVQDSVIITVEGLVIPTGFSPNGDNINDTFEIKGIASFESVSIKVLNRWGEEVFASDDYKNDWNGISKSGSELPNDTYYCVIESPILDKTHTGYIIINR
jgi:gliding motility-associated-like protein